MIRFEVLDYPELVIKHVWLPINNNNYFMKYFSDLKHIQLSEKELMFGVLNMFVSYEMKTLIVKSVSSRKTTYQEGKTD